MTQPHIIIEGIENQVDLFIVKHRDLCGLVLVHSSQLILQIGV